MVDQESEGKESHLAQSHLHQGVYVGFYKTKFKEIKLVLKFILFTAVYPAGKLVSVSFETINGGQFTLSTQLIITNGLVRINSII